MKLRTTTLAIAATVLGLSTLVGPAEAQKNKQGQAGGAAGLVAAVVQVAANDVVDVNVVDSLNNLIALENVLNNSPILSNNDIDVEVGDVNVLNDLIDLGVVDLNVLGIDIGQVVGVAFITNADGVEDILVLI